MIYLLTILVYIIYEIVVSILEVKSDLEVVELIISCLGDLKVQLILLVELILFEARICSFWLLQLILALKLLLNPLLHEYIQT